MYFFLKKILTFNYVNRLYTVINKLYTMINNLFIIINYFYIIVSNLYVIRINKLFTKKNIILLIILKLNMKLNKNPK